MSEENVETVRVVLDAWNRGDWDAALVAAAPDVVFDASGISGEWRGVHRGRDQVKRQWDSFVEPWESVRSEVEEYIDAGEHVVARVTGRSLGREGIEVQTKTGFCFTFRDGLMIHVLVANDFGEALEAAGMSD